MATVHDRLERENALYLLQVVALLPLSTLLRAIISFIGGTGSTKDATFGLTALLGVESSAAGTERLGSRELKVRVRFVLIDLRLKDDDLLGSWCTFGLFLLEKSAERLCRLLRDGLDRSKQQSDDCDRLMILHN